MSRGRRWGVALVTAWALVLVMAAVWSAHRSPATVREQSDLLAGRQSLDRAVEAVVQVAGSQVAAEVEPYRVETGCRVTLARRGTELDRTVLLRVTEGGEEELLDRLAADLPADWQAHHNRASGRLFADAGEFVTVRGEVAAAGEVRVTAATGCRPGEDPALPDQ